MSATRTYLCPACDGYGYGVPVERCFHFGGDPNCDCERECLDCGASGVLELPRAEGDDRGLQPWTGSQGRALSRNRQPQVDLLLTVAQYRPEAADLRRRQPEFDLAYTYYGSTRLRAMRPVSGLARADMLAAAARCETSAETALRAWQVAA